MQSKWEKLSQENQNSTEAFSSPKETRMLAGKISSTSSMCSVNSLNEVVKDWKRQRRGNSALLGFKGKEIYLGTFLIWKSAKFRRLWGVEHKMFPIGSCVWIPSWRLCLWRLSVVLPCWGSLSLGQTWGEHSLASFSAHSFCVRCCRLCSSLSLLLLNLPLAPILPTLIECYPSGTISQNKLFSNLPQLRSLIPAKEKWLTESSSRKWTFVNLRFSYPEIKSNDSLFCTSTMSAHWVF